LPEDVRKYLGEYIDELDKGLHTPPQTPAPQDATPQTAGPDANPQPPQAGTLGEKPKAAGAAAPAEGRGALEKIGKLLGGK
jgi:hypothetical protein